MQTPNVQAVHPFPLRSVFLGKVPYADALDLQIKTVENLKSSLSTSGIIYGLEHPAVITLGKRGRSELDLNASLKDLAELDVDLQWSPRGGQATFHSLGQLVIYPCFSLAEFSLSIKDYVTLIQETTLSCLTSMRIEAWMDPIEPGIYTSLGKIAFFGIKVDRGVVSHGLALNVSNDLNLFNLIRSCGKSGERFASLNRYGVTASLESLFCSWVEEFLLRLR